MSRQCSGQTWLWLLVFLFACAGSASAQTTAPEQPLEPDFRVINLPTTLSIPRLKADFDMSHRFTRNLSSGSFSDNAEVLFGLDAGAVIGLGFRFGVTDNLQVGLYRTSDQTIQFFGKFDVIRQGESVPVSISPIVSIEGADNFREDYQPAVGAVVSHTLGDRIALYATPVWVHNTAAAAGLDRNTAFIGLGARIRVLTRVYLVGEVSPRLGGYDPGDPEFGFGIEKRVGGHVFQLNFTNSFSSTYGQIARGGFPDTIYLGFNLSRKFY